MRSDVAKHEGDSQNSMIGETSNGNGPPPVSNGTAAAEQPSTRRDALSRGPPTQRQAFQVARGGRSPPRNQLGVAHTQARSPDRQQPQSGRQPSEARISNGCVNGNERLLTPPEKEVNLEEHTHEMIPVNMDWLIRMIAASPPQHDKGMEDPRIQKFDELSFSGDWEKDDKAKWVLQLLHEADFSMQCFYISVMYLKLIEQTKKITIHPRNWKRLFTTSLLIADKMWEDKPARLKGVMDVYNGEYGLVTRDSMEIAQIFELEAFFFLNLLDARAMPRLPPSEVAHMAPGEMNWYDHHYQKQLSSIFGEVISNKRLNSETRFKKVVLESAWYENNCARFSSKQHNNAGTAAAAGVYLRSSRTPPPATSSAALTSGGINTGAQQWRGEVLSPRRGSNTELHKVAEPNSRSCTGPAAQGPLQLACNARARTSPQQQHPMQSEQTQDSQERGREHPAASQRQQATAPTTGQRSRSNDGHHGYISSIAGGRPSVQPGGKLGVAGSMPSRATIGAPNSNTGVSRNGRIPASSNLTQSMSQHGLSYGSRTAGDQRKGLDTGSPRDSRSLRVCHTAASTPPQARTPVATPPQAGSFGSNPYLQPPGSNPATARSSGHRGVAPYGANITSVPRR